MRWLSTSTRHRGDNHSKHTVERTNRQQMAGIRTVERANKGKAAADWSPPLARGSEFREGKGARHPLGRQEETEDRTES